ncbi:hypothetical protein BAUCODRAFT_35313 [Baudoinia panamericana UAMH 10762]|uniref:Uncharacterized protein n=1 Tax=Baudoinia panamericana (strain UAMH 10762) TaxID=717646 RepID=M2N8A6_BAUPA|nr:uncharacterized protein BAUCODRAFT_35313 [Baudoinia panamericana UAMH 10762]EMC95329.1 hypothetical protein BAUCODRAFT_35313 [Baudoinia panamericana UAMH 10762]
MSVVVIKSSTDAVINLVTARMGDQGRAREQRRTRNRGRARDQARARLVYMAKTHDQFDQSIFSGFGAAPRLSAFRLMAQGVFHTSDVAPFLSEICAHCTEAGCGCRHDG